MDKNSSSQSLEMLLRAEEEHSAEDLLKNIPEDLRDLIIETQDEIRAVF